MNREVIEFTIERLLTIANDEALRDHFDLGFWANGLETHELDQPEDQSCGFSGCVMGWAVHQQWYAQWGLHLGFTQNPLPFTENPKHVIQPEVLDESELRFRPYLKGPDRYKSQHATEAVAELFGLDLATFDKVIYEEAYENEEATALMVAERLQEILDLGEESFMRVQIGREEQWVQDAR